jgi:hypothetical protein
MKIAMRLLDFHFRCLNARGRLYGSEGVAAVQRIR